MFQGQGQPRYGGFMQQRSATPRRPMRQQPMQAPQAQSMLRQAPPQEPAPSYMPQSPYVPSPGLAGNLGTPPPEAVNRNQQMAQQPYSPLPQGGIGGPSGNTSQGMSAQGPSNAQYLVAGEDATRQAQADQVRRMQQQSPTPAQPAQRAPMPQRPSVSSGLPRETSFLAPSGGQPQGMEQPGDVPSPEEQQRLMPRPMSGGRVY